MCTLGSCNFEKFNLENTLVLTGKLSFTCALAKEQISMALMTKKTHLNLFICYIKYIRQFSIICHFDKTKNPLLFWSGRESSSYKFLDLSLKAEDCLNFRNLNRFIDIYLKKPRY